MSHWHNLGIAQSFKPSIRLGLYWQASLGFLPSSELFFCRSTLGVSNWCVQGASQILDTHYTENKSRKKQTVANIHRRFLSRKSRVFIPWNQITKDLRLLFSNENCHLSCHSICLLNLRLREAFILTCALLGWPSRPASVVLGQLQDLERVQSAMVSSSSSNHPVILWLFI